MSDSLRVAIVDDTPDMRLLVRLSLELDPHIEVVAEAADGRAAIDVAREHRPDVMLLDLAMPVMDGMQALPQVVRASPSTAVLVLSGFAASAMAKEAVAAGARGYLQKGISAEELCQRVWEASGRDKPEEPDLFTLPVDVRPDRDPEQGSAPADPVSELEARALAAEAEVERLRAAIARAAHELRSPVTVLVSLSDAAQAAGNRMPDHQRDQVRAALRRQSDLLRRLTSDLETAAHVEQGVLALELEAVDVGAVARACVESLHEEPPVAVHAGSDVVALADEARLTQILTNLLSNARKYAEPPYDLHVERRGDEVWLTLEDRGDGVPEEFRPLLFEEFTRAHDDTRGTGLGLFVVRTLAEAQGGHVSHEPRQGGGSRFTVRLRAR